MMPSRLAAGLSMSRSSRARSSRRSSSSTPKTARMITSSVSACMPGSSSKGSLGRPRVDHAVGGLLDRRLVGAHALPVEGRQHQLALAQVLLAVGQQHRVLAQHRAEHRVGLAGAQLVGRAAEQQLDQVGLEHDHEARVEQRGEGHGVVAVAAPAGVDPADRVDQEGGGLHHARQPGAGREQRLGRSPVALRQRAVDLAPLVARLEVAALVAHVLALGQRDLHLGLRALEVDAGWAPRSGRARRSCRSAARSRAGAAAACAGARARGCCARRACRGRCTCSAARPRRRARRRRSP